MSIYLDLSYGFGLKNFETYTLCIRECYEVNIFLCNVTGPAMEYNYGYPAMEKRTASRPTLSDYLRLAAIQYEMDKEEDEAADAQNAGSVN